VTQTLPELLCGLVVATAELRANGCDDTSNGSKRCSLPVKVKDTGRYHGEGLLSKVLVLPYKVGIPDGFLYPRYFMAANQLNSF
jgi:hypothetical protein